MLRAKPRSLAALGMTIHNLLGTRIHDLEDGSQNWAVVRLGLRARPVKQEIPSTSLRASSSLRLKNGSAQDDNRVQGAKLYQYPKSVLVAEVESFGYPWSLHLMVRPLCEQ